VLHLVAKVLLQQPELEWGSPSQVLVADDCFALSTISSVRTADLLARAVTESLGRRLITHKLMLAYVKFHCLNHLYVAENMVFSKIRLSETVREKIVKESSA